MTHTFDILVVVFLVKYPLIEPEGVADGWVVLAYRQEHLLTVLMNFKIGIILETLRLFECESWITAVDFVLLDFRPMAVEVVRVIVSMMIARRNIISCPFIKRRVILVYLLLLMIAVHVAPGGVCHTLWGA